METVDVIIPFHRSDSYLFRAVQSVLNSEDVSVNLILIDDRKSDERESLGKLENYIRYRTNGQEGFPNSMNYALQYLNSDFVSLCASDDLVHPSKFRKQTEALKTNNSDLCITGMIKIDVDDQISAEMIRIDNLENFQPEWLLVSAIGADGSWMGRKQWWKENIFFPQGPVHDWELALRVMPSTKVAIIKEPLYQYRMHHSQSSRSHLLNFETLDSFLNQWMIFNRECNLPDLNKEEILTLLFPYAVKRNKFTKQTGDWLQNFISMTNFNNDVKKIVSAKLIYLALVRRTKIPISLIDLASIRSLLRTGLKVAINRKFKEVRWLYSRHNKT